MRADAREDPSPYPLPQGEGESSGAADACAIAVYYNGACPVCGPEIERFRRAAHHADAPFAWHDLAAHPEALAAHRVTAADARRRLHVIDGQGRLHIGIDAFILIWSQLPGYRRLAPLVRLPLVHAIAAAAYNHVLAPALALLNERTLHRQGGSQSKRRDRADVSRSTLPAQKQGDRSQYHLASEVQAQPDISSGYY
jgi:predicted DCC family thiol-disulfide oxidoreductase YuxK